MTATETKPVVQNTAANPNRPIAKKTFMPRADIESGMQTVRPGMKKRFRPHLHGKCGTP